MFAMLELGEHTQAIKRQVTGVNQSAGHKGSAFG